MRFSQTAAALVALASLSFATPVLDEVLEQGSFTLEQVDSGRTYLKSAALDMRHVYLRYNGSVPKEVEDAAAAAKKGTVTTRPQVFDRAYLTPVQIGTPPKTLMLDIDTGSSDLWVFSGNLPAKQQKGHAVYFPKKSSSSKNFPKLHWKIRYGDGSSASGKVVKDKVTVGGVSFAQQAVEIAGKISGQFSSKQLKSQDGLFGFGFSSINTVRPAKQKTWFDNVKGSLQAPVFCADLKPGKPGSYDIGFINPAHYSGAIHYVPVNKGQGFWQFQTNGHSVGGRNFGGSFSAIADTGTSLIYLPNAVVNDYYRQTNRPVKSRGMIFIPCSQKLPSFSLNIGGSKRTVPGKLITYAFAGTVRGERYCAGGIQPNTGFQGLSILGDVFLKSQYVVFDSGKTRIGFANK